MPHGGVAGWLMALGIAGLAAAGVLLLGGRDPRRAGRSARPGGGRALAAGLALLSAVGVVVAGRRMVAERHAPPAVAPASAAAAAATQPGGGAAWPGAPAGALPPLQAERHRRTIREAWRFARPLADGARSTAAQRTEAVSRLNVAVVSARLLASSGGILDAEADLLASEAARVIQAMFREPPTDARSLVGTMPDESPPAEQAVLRLTPRLPLLRSVAASGRADAQVAALVLPTVRADLATLARDRETSRLTPMQQMEAEAIREEVRLQLWRIDRLLAGPGNETD